MSGKNKVPLKDRVAELENGFAALGKRLSALEAEIHGNVTAQDEADSGGGTGEPPDHP